MMDHLAEENLSYIALQTLLIELTSAGEGYFLAILYVVYRSLNISP